MRLTINHINGRRSDSSAHKRFRSKRHFNVFFPTGTQHFTVFYILKEPPSKFNNSSETLRKLSKHRNSSTFLIRARELDHTYFETPSRLANTLCCSPSRCFDGANKELLADKQNTPYYRIIIHKISRIWKLYQRWFSTVLHRGSAADFVITSITSVKRKNNPHSHPFTRKTETHSDLV